MRVLELSEKAANPAYAVRYMQKAEASLPRPCISRLQKNYAL